MRLFPRFTPCARGACACFEDDGSFAPELKVVSSSSDPELCFGTVAANAGSGPRSAVTVTIADV